MTIYCDRITFTTALQAFRLGFSSPRETGRRLLVLDPLPERGLCQIFKAVLNRVGFIVEEASFEGGRLRTPDGIAIGAAARQASLDLALDAAERLVRGSAFLNRLNSQWGRNTIQLYIARCLSAPSINICNRIMAAEALARTQEGETCYLLAERNGAIDAELLLGLVHYVTPLFFVRARTTLRDALHEIGRFLYRIIRGKLRPGSKKATDPGLDSDRPSLLLLQEDDLSMDRSYRYQPHWLFVDDGKPDYQTIIIRTGDHVRVTDEARLREHGIVAVMPADMARLSHSPQSDGVDKRLKVSMNQCALRSLQGFSSPSWILLSLCNLFERARGLSRFCRRFHVKAFMTCENYMVWADAMQVIAPALDIKTLSYQYSNLRRVGPLMLTTADLMLTFSPLYEQRWSRKGIRPRGFASIGYVFDAVPPLVRKRSSEARNKLREAGASFVISYFDETIQYDKYGVISQREYQEEFRLLLDLLQRDNSVGLVVKAQFQRNSPSNHEAMALAIESARKTRRYLELSAGVHRNIVYPVEAALCSDMTIGNTVGASASLEAALAGVRSILINPYGIRGANDALYAKASIVYPSMGHALEAIERYRAGAPGYVDLGDWSPILDAFDPFRDGKSRCRMQKILQDAVLEKRADGHGEPAISS